MRTIIILALVISLLAAGCAKETSETKDTTEPDSSITGDVAAGIDEVDSLQRELDDSELDSIDNDLSELNW
ncbi:hypothetical protein JXA85_08650 [Candidatus Woesearchaeota archaeon]|nr:hypothetical protein [Candidatus Woesearchaeota archaeon]